MLSDLNSGRKVIGADETDCFAMFFAAMVHDLDHPGETNASAMQRTHLHTTHFPLALTVIFNANARSERNRSENVKRKGTHGKVPNRGGFAVRDLVRSYVFLFSCE